MKLSSDKDMFGLLLRLWPMDASVKVRAAVGKKPEP